MSFQWLDLRLSEEVDRRRREQEILRNLPLAIEELHRLLKTCVAEYTTTFGADSAVIEQVGAYIRIQVREAREDRWQTVAKVDITADPAIPGFHIDRAGANLIIDVGMLPGERIFYRDRESDQYLNSEELTRRILDRALFPKLKE